MHRIHRTIRIRFRFAYSFLLIGIGIGVALILIYFFLLQRTEVLNERSQIFPKGAEYLTNQIIIKYKEGYVVQQLLPDMVELGVISQRKLFTGENPLLNQYYLLTLPEGSDIEWYYDNLSKLPEIDVASPDYILKVQENPNDRYYPDLWGLYQMNAQQAWDKKNGNSNTLVAVIDTGVETTHEDLRGNVIPGINTVSGTNNSLDDHGHGTHVAGTVGAITNNSIGVSSISWGTKILSIKACDSNGDCNTSDVVRGIQYAIQQGARIVNISVAGEGSCRGTYDDVIQFATENNTLVVVASGNGIDGKGVDARNWIPASCKDVFTVGAIGPDGKNAVYSNYGSVVSIAAPGGNRGIEPCTNSTCILSTNINNSYSLRQGTSMAAPFVSGAGALLLSYNPELSLAQLKTCLMNGDTIVTDKYIGKRLNVEKALEMCAKPSQKVEQEERLSISGRVFIDANTNRMFDPSELVISDAQVILSGFASQSVLSNTTGRYIFSDLEPGFYTVTLSMQGKSIGGFSDVSLQPLFPHVQIDLPVPSSEVNYAPRPTASDNQSSTIQCVPDPSCNTNSGSLQICTLKCE